MKGVSAAAPPSSSFYRLQSKTLPNYHYSYGLISVGPRISCLSHTKLNHDLFLRLGTGASESLKFNVRCNSSNAGPGGPGSGNNDSRSVLDAFFLGKALAEALNERVESAVGEFLSAVGRLQAEQQKQIQDFQEDVLTRAKKAKEQAARETMDEQVLVPKPTAVDATSVNDGVTQETSPSTANAYETGSNPASKGPVLGLSSDD